MKIAEEEYSFRWLDVDPPTQPAKNDRVLHAIPPRLHIYYHITKSVLIPGLHAGLHRMQYWCLCSWTGKMEMRSTSYIICRVQHPARVSAMMAARSDWAWTWTTKHSNLIRIKAPTTKNTNNDIALTWGRDVDGFKVSLGVEGWNMCAVNGERQGQRFIH